MTTDERDDQHTTRPAVGGDEPPGATQGAQLLPTALDTAGEPLHFAHEPYGLVRLSGRVALETWANIKGDFAFINGDVQAEEFDEFDLEGLKFWALAPRDGETLDATIRRLEQQLGIAEAWQRTTLDAREAEEAAHQAAVAAHLERREKLFPPRVGEYVQRGDTFDGILHGAWYRVGAGFTIYGGGEEFCIEDDDAAIWRVWNNGADGDDWNQNNIVTGGAGAIGRRYPATSERLEYVRSLPPTRPQPPKVLAVHQEYFHGHVNAALWLAEAAEGPVATTSKVIWVIDEASRIFYGLASDGTQCYLGSDRDRGRARLPGLPTFYLAHFYGVALVFPATPERVAAIRARWPEWVGTDLRGRFTGFGYGNFSDNAADALRGCLGEQEPVNRVHYVPGVTVRHVAANHKWALWSDGQVTRGGNLGHWYSYGASKAADDAYARAHPGERAWQVQEGWPELLPLPPATPPPTLSLTKDAETLIGITIAGGRSSTVQVADLMGVAHIVARTEIARRERQGGWSTEITLTEIVVEHGDGVQHSYYEGSWIAGGLVDGEGEVDDGMALFAERAEAQAWFDEEVRTLLT